MEKNWITAALEQVDRRTVFVVLDDHILIDTPFINLEGEYIETTIRYGTVHYPGCVPDKQHICFRRYFPVLQRTCLATAQFGEGIIAVVKVEWSHAQH